MLTWFRRFAKSPIAVVLFGLLLISFAVFGISDVFNASPMGNAIVKAGDRSIGDVQFKQTFDGYLKQLAQQNQGQPVTTEEAVANGVDRRILEELAYSESFNAMVARIGLRPSDKLVIDEVRKIPVFFDQISGRFDRATYQQKLRENGLTETVFEGDLRDSIARNHLVDALASGLSAPRTYAAALATFSGEGRAVQWFAIKPAMVQMPTAPTDAQLAAYIKANAARFTKPETRQITVVSFSAAAIAPTVQINPADVQKRFDFEKDSLSTPEKRTFVQVPVKDAAAAADAVARLRKGEDPAAVAKRAGTQPVAYTDAPKTAVSDRIVGDAAFSMTAGEVRGPIQGSLGLSVVKLTSVTPAKIAQLDDVRAKVEAQVRQDLAVERVYEQVKKYEDARSGGAGLVEAAKAVGITPIVVPVPLTAQGVTLQGQQTNMPPPMLQAAFSLPQGGESEVQDAGQGEYYAVRVDKVNPSAVATLDEVRPQATQVYMIEEMRKRMTARAEELAGRIRKGEAIDAVGRSAGADVTKVADVRRDGAGVTLTRPVVETLFTAKRGETIVVPDDQLGVVVVKVDAIVPGDPTQLARGLEAQRATLRNNLFNEIGYGARNAARDRIKPKIDYARARTALGLEPLPATPAGGAAAPAPGTKQ